MDKITFMERRDLAQWGQTAQSPQMGAKILQFRRPPSAPKGFKTGQADDQEHGSGPALKRGPWLAF